MHTVTNSKLVAEFLVYGYFTTINLYDREYQDEYICNKKGINGLFECFHERNTFRFTKESLHYVFI